MPGSPEPCSAWPFGKYRRAVAAGSGCVMALPLFTALAETSSHPSDTSTTELNGVALEQNC
jgi:hypothetical protein